MAPHVCSQDDNELVAIGLPRFRFGIFRFDSYGSAFLVVREGLRSK